MANKPGRLAARLAAAALWAMTAGGATAPAAGGMLLDGVAACVNERMITIAEVMDEIRGSVQVDLPKAEREARLRELYTSSLDAMIDRRLILDAARAAKAEVASWAVDNRVQEIIDQRFGGDRAALTAALASRRMTYEEWRTGIEEEMLIQLMRYGQVERGVSVPPGEVRAHYHAHRESFRAPGGVHVALIVFSAPRDGGTTLAGQGERILKELAGGKAFADAARAYSRDSKASRGGDWGVVDPAEVFRPEIVAALAKLKVGEYSPAVLLEDYGYIVRKIDERQPRPLTLEEAWPLVEGRLRLQQAEQRYRAWLGRLRAKAYIRIFELPQPK